MDVVDLDFGRSAVKILARRRNIFWRQCDDRGVPAITCGSRGSTSDVAVTVFVVFRAIALLTNAVQ